MDVRQQQTPTSQDASQTTPSSKDSKFTAALEKVLASINPEEVEKAVKESSSAGDEPYEPEIAVKEYDDAEDQDIEVTEGKETKNKTNKKMQKKKKKKKKSKSNQNKKDKEGENLKTKSSEPVEQVEVEYIPEVIQFLRHDPYYEFSKVFEAFKITEHEKNRDLDKADDLRNKSEEKKPEEIPIKARGILDMDDEKVPEENKQQMSKKKLKKRNRLSVAELKQLVQRPDVVEMHDVTSRDPKLLVHLKATRNTVTVPRHWCFKRKYLQGKRGIEKPPFELPDYIKATGIMEMRQALMEKEDQKTMKAKMRERVRPKMGKMEIDYQLYHDAFFKLQKIPRMTIHGDLYYEGKEFETRLKEKKPGNLSDELRVALGMPIGANSERFPPPWLIAMQRYGPPPSYPNLKIPGLNAPVPEGCSFGFQLGGWGKTPVDESGKPLYGDVFGATNPDPQAATQDEEVDKTRWGELESESEEEEELSDEDEDKEPDEAGLVTPAETGLVTPSGVASIPLGMETPDMIELRKKRIEDAMDQGGDTPALYTILPEKKTTIGTAMMGSAHVYDISAAMASAKKAGEKVSEGIEVALNPEELDLDTAAMQAKYDQTVREQQAQIEKEDLSDMVAEHNVKQQKKRKKQQQQQESVKAKKMKEFKF